MKPLLTELADLIQDGDTEASDILDDLKEHLGDSELRERIKSLESQISNYDFDEAQETLTEIVEELGFKG